ATRRLCRLLEEGQAIGGAIGDGDLFNVFEGVAPRAFPELLSIRAAFLAAGARQVHMAGSGPALFALASDPEEAHRLAEALIARRVPTFVTTAPAQEDGPP
ncbi:MAG TPA: hypothetical protein VJM69_06775, partial [Dehalococcoidia bacterium]|nr:hypothetical protein [Dehalococcoidia bacterium]